MTKLEAIFLIMSEYNATKGSVTALRRLRRCLRLLEFSYTEQVEVEVRFEYRDKQRKLYARFESVGE